MFELIEVVLESGAEVVMVLIMILIMLWSSGVRPHLPQFLSRRSETVATVVVESVPSESFVTPGIEYSAEVLNDPPSVVDSTELQLPRIGFTDLRFPEHALALAVYTMHYPAGRVGYGNRDGPTVITSGSAPCAGLAQLWSELGSAICREAARRYEVSEAEVARRVEVRFILPVCTPGEPLCECVRAFQANWYTSEPDNESALEALRNAAALVQMLLVAVLEQVATDLLAEAKVRAAPCVDGVLILETEQPWEDVVVNELPEVQFVGFRKFNGSWILYPVPLQAGSPTPGQERAMRVALPASWHGAVASQLVNLSGVSEARVCDVSGRWCTAATRTGIERLAERAQSND